MADNTQNNDVQYTSDELQEIERIIGILPGSDRPVEDTDIMSLADQEQNEDEAAKEMPEEDEAAEEAPEEYIPLEEMDFGEVPEDLSSGFDEVDSPDGEGDASEPEEDELPELEDVDILSEPEDEPVELPDITDSITEIPDVSEEELDFDTAPGEDVVDIDESEEMPFGDEDTTPDEDFESVDLSGVELPPIDDQQQQPYQYRPKTGGPTVSPDSTLGQLNELTKDEPESVDAYEIDDNAFVEAGEEQETEEQPEEETSLEGSVDSEEMPDLDSLDLSEETAGLDEGDLSELPDMDFDTFNEDLEQGEDAGEVIGGIEPELGEIPEQSDEDELSSLGSEMDELENTDFGSLDELPSVDEIEAPAVSETAEPVDDLEPIESVSGLEDDLPDLSTDVPGIEPVDEDQDERPAAERKGLDFTPDELKKIKKALILFPIGLTDAIKDTILNDRLGETDTRRLADMILEGRPEDNIHRFLEKRLKQKIDKEGGRGASRRVIMSRPEYSREGRERQQVLLRRTRNIALGAAAALVIGIGAYRMIYIPQKANSLIAEGTRLIRRFSEEKFPDYQRAEEIFTLVDEKYIKDYIYAYNEYGRAYFDKQEYYRSLMKLNKAYDLAVEKGFNTAESVRTLNELGYFYSAKKRDREDAPGNFDDFFQKSVKLNLDEYYFNKIPPLGTVNTQYDLALDFYQKALNRDPDNIRSLLGIGDVYQNQGQFLKARQYYENILEIDRDSIAGHAGLLNLFIEQDNFSETVTEFVNLRNRKNLKELPSALLAKLANYLLSKTKTESTNIRIEYGIQSPRLKDSNDQPFPAVVEVLKALREKDPDYPPLYTAYARLSLKQKNIKLAKEYLENGLKRSAKQGYPFFAGHHMMGEYYFYTKQPDAAYDHFRKALKDQKSPPEYTYDRYYEEQEEVGDTYAMLGNIFYYFFDEVRFRTGDQETVSEIEMRQNQDMMGNFNIAGDYYEEALQSGYESPEVHYNLGRIHYLNRLYAQARDQWLNLYDEFTTSPELMLGLGNVFYKLGNYDTAQSQFMKLTNIYEYEADRIREAQAENQTHNKVFGTLSSAYNNLGAVYQKQGELEKSAISYWNAIEYAQKINEENEFARVNLARGTREREEPVDPILDDNIPYSIDYYTEKMRW